MNKTAWIILLLFLFALIGYTREFFFVHINVILFEKYYHSVSPAPFPAIMNPFRVFSYETLYYSKYFFTLFWVGVYFALSWLTLKRLGNTPVLIRFLKYTYATMLIVAFLSMSYGYLVHQRLQDDEYTLSRWLMGIAQSPIICLILLASEKLYNKSFKP